MTYGGDTDGRQDERQNVVSKLGTEREEEEALVTALRNTFMPRLLDRDASIFTTLIHDLWPEVGIPMLFGGRQTPDSEIRRSKSGSESRLSKNGTKMSRPLDVRSYRGQWSSFID